MSSSKQIFFCSVLVLSTFANGQTSRITDELVVSGEALQGQAIATLPFPVTTLDTARILNALPGASANKNGVITGIAQYRGLFGDRIAVTLDGMPVVGGGPNAMDAPLSYSTPLMTESVSIERGIVSVRHAEAMGGHVATRTDRGDFGASENFEFDGRLAARFGESGDTTTAGGRLTFTNSAQRFSLAAESGEAGDYETGGGTLLPSRFNRDRFDLSYAVKSASTEAEFYASQLNTTDAGTPALPMDIRSIDTSLYGANLAITLSNWDLQARYSVNDVAHWMDNFGLRTAPATAMMYRQTYATGESNALSFEAATRVGEMRLSLGLDQRKTRHDATITNPNMAMFAVQNFIDAQRNSEGLYVELEGVAGAASWSIGARADKVDVDAGSVSANGMMGAMATNANTLATAFNNADRSREFNTLDLVAGVRMPAADNLDLLLEIGSRSRAPAYQELYLWLPMEATGGLADGRTYIGNLDLKPEQNNELVAGLDWQLGKLSLSPRVYVRDVSNYIQGSPSTNMTANMLSNMMSGAAALEFTNQDAQIVGLDVRWNYSRGTTQFSGSISSSRGELSNGSDNHYRQAPDRMLTAVQQQIGKFSLGAELELVAPQNEVSAFNSETTSAGYGLVHIGASWQATSHLVVTSRIDNLLDKAYQAHLAGVNRVSAADIAVGERIYGESRAIWLGLDYRFD